jgi:hypothetical protein
MPGPVTRISTDAYCAVFRDFRKANFIDGAWNCHGKDFMGPLNEAIMAFQKTVADNKTELATLTGLTLLDGKSRDAFDDKVVTKHTQTRAKIRKDLRKQLNIEFNVPHVPKGSPRGTTEDLTSLSSASRVEYMERSSANKARIAASMPSLPSWDGTRKSRASTSGEDLLNILEG